MPDGVLEARLRQRPFDRGSASSFGVREIIRRFRAGTVRLEEQAGGTRMIVEIACRSEEHLSHFVAMGIAAGTSKTLDNLLRHLRKA